MIVDFIRFKATDQVELQGWLSNVPGDTAVVHVHGMSGNGYENYFLDNLREMYAKHSISFFSFDNRGRGTLTDFRQGDGSKQGGSCFELIEESLHDIQGAIDYLKSLKKTKIILQGHSLGCAKVVDYLVKNKAPEVTGVILIAPTDMVRWGQADSKHNDYLAKAKKMMVAGSGDELVEDRIWTQKTPISAKTYISLCEPGGESDIYSKREDGTWLGRVQIPMLMVYGDHDAGVQKTDGSVENWVKRVEEIKNSNTKVVIVSGAQHSFRGCEVELAKSLESFLLQIV